MFSLHFWCFTLDTWARTTVSEGLVLNYANLQFTECVCHCMSWDYNNIWHKWLNSIIHCDLTYNKKNFSIFTRACASVAKPFVCHKTKKIYCSANSCYANLFQTLYLPSLMSVCSSSLFFCLSSRGYEPNCWRSMSGYEVAHLSISLFSSHKTGLKESWAFTSVNPIWQFILI